jgi:flavin-dependent dehydrogenase
VIVGGGPAGSATALALLRSGRAVAVLERSRFERPRVGETLPPEARRFLAPLGVLERFEKEGHLPSPGIVSLWGSDAPEENDFIFNPHGHGWHLDRNRFDRMLLEVARERGACVELGAPVTGGRAGARWRLASGERVYEGDLVIDAAGRSPLPFGPERRRVAHDRLVALVGFGRAEGRCDARTVLEAAEVGWWYGARLPGDGFVATLMTDPGLVHRDYARFWREEVGKTRLLRERLEDASAFSVSAHRCTTTLRVPVVKDGWVAVGDAASAFDPLASQGICKAIDGATRLGDAIASGRLEDYAAWVRASFEDHLSRRAAFYALVRRWPSSPFWRLRIA